MSHDDDDYRPRRRRDDDDFDDRDRGGRRRNDDDDYGRGSRNNRSEAQSKVSGPGTALMIYGLLSLVLSVGALGVYVAAPDVVYRPIYDFVHDMQDKAKQNQANQFPPPKIDPKAEPKKDDGKGGDLPKAQAPNPADPFNQPIPNYEEFKKQNQVTSIISCIFSLIFALLITIGGMKMKSLSGYGLAMTASILCMIPCTNICCIIGLPIGLWALIVLMNQDVKSAFR
jgi:hypothetical protein